MTQPPDFDELVGFDVEAGERDRLRRVHALLVEAGPPAEVPPELEAGPTLAMTLGRARTARRGTRRVMLLAAAIVVLALAFLGGYLAGNGGRHGIAAAETMRLVGTKTAPSAFASLQLSPVDASGNWPMRLTVTGLPKLPAHTFYEVYLVRDGKPYAPCGTFIVSSAKRATSVQLNAPYRLRRGDTWIVTKQAPGQPDPGTVMLHPIA